METKSTRKTRYELYTFICGLGFLASMASLTFGPPLLAPTKEGAASWIAAFLAMGFLAGMLGSCVLAIVHRRVWLLLSAFILGGAYWGMRESFGYADVLWTRHFESTAPVRARFVEFMKQQSTSADDSRVALPAGFEAMTAEKFAYLYEPEKGARSFCYASFTHGIDNSSGFCWSENGKPPPRLAFPEIVWSKPLGGGWFMFSST